MAAKENVNEGTTGVVDSPPSETVVQAIADAEDTTPLELSPLYEAIDPDALNTLFQGRTAGRVTFDYEGYTVTVGQNGEVTIQK